MPIANTEINIIASVKTFGARKGILKLRLNQVPNKIEITQFYLELGLV